MITDNGLNIIALTLANQFSDGCVGTDNSEPTTGDSDLKTPILATLKSFDEKNATSNLVTLIYQLTTSEGNGQTLKEFGTFINDGTNNILVSRFIHPSINKTDQIALVYRVEYLVERK